MNKSIEQQKYEQQYKTSKKLTGKFEKQSKDQLIFLSKREFWVETFL